MMARASILLALLVGLAGCSDQTAVILEVDGDLTVGVDVDELVFLFSKDGDPAYQKRYPLRNLPPFPHSVALLPGQKVSGTFDVRVTASLMREEKVSASRTVSFVEGQVVTERICLWSFCEGSDREECARGDCDLTPPDGDGDVDADSDSDVDGDVDADSDSDGDSDSDADLDEDEEEACVPDCGDRECGLDPVCGTEDCGTCDEGETCSEEGQCVCEGEVCLGECCAVGQVCNADTGECCSPDCGIRECGFDPVCGALSCGECGANLVCNDDHVCECQNAICDGACCSEGQICSALGDCCTPNCLDRECGLDPVCGALDCGSCGENQTCSADGHCECLHEECGGTCCAEGQVCTASGTCCTPVCDGRECGNDGCGGECGPGCSTGEACVLGACAHAGPHEWVTIEPGSFFMGSPFDERGRYDIELRHEVTLTHAFVMYSTPVTSTEFAAVMGYQRSYHSPTGGGPVCGMDCPAERVTWHEAAAYCNALSSAEGRPLCYDCVGSGTTVTCDLSPDYPTPYDCPGYRLPTEAEWEYAARAGTSSATYNGELGVEADQECGTPDLSSLALDPIAWWCGNGDDNTHPVGTLEPNAWNLYDMLGNIWEYCSDWFDLYLPGSIRDPWGPPTPTEYGRVVRGGSYVGAARDNRAATRNASQPEDYYINQGLRPVRTLFLP